MCNIFETRHAFIPAVARSGVGKCFYNVQWRRLVVYEAVLGEADE